MRNSSGPQNWIRDHATPVTATLVALIVVSSIIAFVSPAANHLLGFDPGEANRIYTAFTYVFAGNLTGGYGLFFFIFLLIWLVQTGGSVETDLGAKRYVGLLFVLTLIGSLVWLVGSTVMGQKPILMGATILQAAIAVAWCVRHAAMPVNFLLIGSVQAKWLGWLFGLVVLTSYGFANPVFGVIATVPLIVAALFADNKIPGLPYSAPVCQPKQSKASRAKEAAYLDSVKDRERERSERERLRKLFESSMKDE